MQIRSSRRLAAVALALLFAFPVHAHSGADEAIPETEGTKLGVVAVARSLRASDRLPSQGLPGYLLLGDPGLDYRGFQLEHAVAQLGYRFTNALGAELSLGAHGSDPVHVESAWLQGRGTIGVIDWTLGAGRQNPSMGPVLTRAGHLDRYGLMPLAKHAVTNGDWIDDGAELALKQRTERFTGTLDLGLWSGQVFPGSPRRAASPSVHLGGNWELPAGEVWLDVFAAQLRPTGRGSRITSTNGSHTHVAPRCDASLNGVVCFDGRSRIAGLSAQWEGNDWPVTLTGAVLWRNEEGTLQSRNGLAKYGARNRGEWLQAAWRWSPAWETGVRHERLRAAQTLIGPGAGLVASEAGLGAYAPQRRTAAMLGWTATPWAEVRLEGGREVGAQATRFVALRLVLQWERSLASSSP